MRIANDLQVISNLRLLYNPFLLDSLYSLLFGLWQALTFLNWVIGLWLGFILTRIPEATTKWFLEIDLVYQLPIRIPLFNQIITVRSLYTEVWQCFHLNITPFVETCGPKMSSNLSKCNQYHSKIAQNLISGVIIFA